jgi:hypothetical protein
VLALLELDLGGRADLDHRDTAGQLGQALLQLLAVVVGVALLDLRTDLVDPAVDLVGVTGSVDDGRLVLGDDHLAGLAEQVDAGVLQLQADGLADDLATGEDGDVGQHGLAAVAEARRLDGDGLERAAHLVDDQGGQRLPSMSSAMMNSGLPDCITFSSSGSRSLTLVILDSTSRTYASSRTASMRSGSVQK